MDTDNTFTGWCCSLVSGETEIAGTLVDLAELKLPSDKEQLHKQLPGLSMRVDNIITTYVLITSHSVLPGSTCLEEWKFSEKFLGRQAAEKTLDVFVSGVLSCCGPKSFVIGSDTTVNEHHHKDCSLGLNFTMLFFNEDFQQHYCAHFGTEVNPPAMTLSQCEADIEWIDQCLSTAKNNVPENALAPRARVVSFIVINASCIEVAIESASKRKEQSLPDLQLYKEITKFDRVKSVQCKSSESSCHPLFVEGMALVCRSDANNDSLKLIGVLTGHGKALILSALLQLLKGSPAPCLSLLLYTDMRRLWINKWSHLIIPHLESLQGCQPEQSLQILTVLFRKKNPEENYLSVTPTDPAETRLGFLKLIQALFHHFHDQRKLTMTLKTEVISNQTKCDFLHEISVVCWSLLTLCEDCGSYSNMENDIVKQLCIHCVRCANVMLDYQHEQEVVEKELFKDDDAFEPLLSRLRNCSCSSPNIDPWPGPMIDFYRKRHIYSKSVHARQMDDLSKEIHKLNMKIRHLEHAKQGAAIHNEMPTGERAIPAPTEAREEESNNNEHSSTAVVYYRPPIGRFGPRVEHRPLADE